MAKARYEIKELDRDFEGLLYLNRRWENLRQQLDGDEVDKILKVMRSLRLGLAFIEEYLYMLNRKYNKDREKGGEIK